jgi:RNA polymerase-binding transcription factor DksA
MLNTCRICKNLIELERLNVLPSTVFCSNCAHKHNTVKPRRGVMIYDSKVGGELQIMSAELYEREKKYYEPIGARSAVKNFSRNVCA